MRIFLLNPPIHPPTHPQVPYVDVCDDARLATVAKSLSGQAQEAGVAATISAGIWPGIDQLMAVEVSYSYDSSSLDVHTERRCRAVPHGVSAEMRALPATSTSILEFATLTVATYHKRPKPVHIYRTTVCRDCCTAWHRTRSRAKTSLYASGCSFFRFPDSSAFWCILRVVRTGGKMCFLCTISTAIPISLSSRSLLSHLLGGLGGWVRRNYRRAKCWAGPRRWSRLIFRRTPRARETRVRPS